MKTFTMSRILLVVLTLLCGISNCLTTVKYDDCGSTRGRIAYIKEKKLNRRYYNAPSIVTAMCEYEAQMSKFSPSPEDQNDEIHRYIKDILTSQ
ncbi:hypothetical protein ABKN59_006667 [Abortiporus biennis]